MWTNFVVAAGLLLASIALIVTHCRAWRDTQEYEANSGSFDFARRQFRRRMQASSLIGAVGIAIAASSWIPGTVAKALYWSGVLLVVVWIGLLALADLFGSRVHYQRVAAEHHAAHAALTAELKRLQRRGGNGKPESRSDE
jgi:hypothetical protein